MSTQTLIERFTEKIAEPFDAHNDCWMWAGYTGGQGPYPQLSFGGKHIYAHRVSHELFIGPIPEGCVIDHLCKNTLCVNPDHLEAVHQRINLRRGNGHGHETHCPAGHLYDSANTYTRNGMRTCRACGRIRAREKYQRDPVQGAAKRRKSYQLRKGGC
jgi:HNH endonuclease